MKWRRFFRRQRADRELQQESTIFSRVYTTYRGADKAASRWRNGWRSDDRRVRIVPMVATGQEVK